MLLPNSVISEVRRVVTEGLEQATSDKHDPMTLIHYIDLASHEILESPRKNLVNMAFFKLVSNLILDFLISNRNK